MADRSDVNTAIIGAHSQAALYRDVCGAYGSLYGHVKWNVCIYTFDMMLMIAESDFQGNMLHWT